MASVFWDSSGIIFIDYLEKGKTINSDYYCAICIIGLIERKNHVKTVSFVKEQIHLFARTMAKIN